MLLTDIASKVRSGAIIPFCDNVNTIKSKAERSEEQALRLNVLEDERSKLEEERRLTSDTLSLNARDIASLKERNELLQRCLNNALSEIQAIREVSRAITSATSTAGTPQSPDSKATNISSSACNVHESSSAGLDIQDGLDSVDLAQPQNAALFKKQYRILGRALKETEKAKDLAVLKWSNRRRQAEEWVSYAKGLERKLAALKAKHGLDVPSIGADDNARESAIGVPVYDRTHTSTVSGRQEVTSQTIDVNRAVVEEETILPSLINGNPPAGQDEGMHFNSGSTEGEPTHEEQVDQIAHPETSAVVKEENDDSPLVVSSRCVNKRRHNIATSATPIIKTEPTLSSSPMGMVRLTRLVQQESMDLDVHHKGSTPKKKKRGEHIFNDEPTPPSGHNNASRRALLLLAEEDELSLQTPAVRKKIQATVRTPLQPRSPNETLPRTSTSESVRKRRKVNSKSSGAAILGEDVDEDGVGIENIDPAKAQRIKDVQRQRLDGLLDASTPQGPVLASVPRESSLGAQKSPSMPKIAGPQMATTIATLLPQGPIAKGPSPSQDEQRISLELNDPKHEPFRARPLRKLALEHFKINPACNEGFKFAFADPIRGKERRKCMQGCTEPSCCGTKFRPLAESILASNGSSSEALMENQKLLEHFMGHRKERLVIMSAEERHEMLVRAKTIELSNQHGKHRALYERRVSPPGFWNVDFPSTQEHEENCKDADAMEREMVEKRWKEAMRNGGRWLFRDE